MGLNTLRTAVDGEVIPATDTTQYKEALVGDLVPRDTNGIPTDSAGSLGSTTYQWDKGYFTGALLSESDVAMGGAVVNTVTTLGSSQVVLPAGTNLCKVQIFGAGGAGNSGGGFGGGGGAYVSLELDLLSTPGLTLDLFVGTGGASSGTAGGASYLTINAEEVARANGGNGGAGSAVTGGVPQLRPITSSVDYRMLESNFGVGGSSATIPSTLAGYATSLVGSFSTGSGGASIQGNGGASNSVGNGAGGGGYADGGTASGGIGIGGDGAIVITYYKGERV